MSLLLGDLKTGLSSDLGDMAAYVASLSAFPNSPYRNSNGTLIDAGPAGQAVFQAKNCQSCHSGANFTGDLKHDVGTIQANSGLGIDTPLAGVGFNTPTLKMLWLDPPYLHNGQAATLADVLNNTTHIGSSTAQEKADLEQYLLQIDDTEPTPPTPAPTLQITNIVPLSGASYQVGTLNDGVLVYIDRTFLFSNTPAFYQGKTFINL